MVNFETFRQIALSFPSTTEQPHFEKLSYRLGKKIFATYNDQKNQASLKLNEIDQSVFCAFDPSIIFPVPNKWGKQGWTLVNLNMVREDLLVDALTTAYQGIVKPSNKSIL